MGNPEIVVDLENKRAILMAEVERYARDLGEIEEKISSVKARIGALDSVLAMYRNHTETSATYSERVLEASEGSVSESELVVTEEPASVATEEPASVATEEPASVATSRPKPVEPIKRHGSSKRFVGWTYPNMLRVIAKELGSPFHIKQAVEAVQAGGGAGKSKDLRSTLHTTLSRMPKEFGPLGSGEWELKDN